MAATPCAALLTLMHEISKGTYGKVYEALVEPAGGGGAPDPAVIAVPPRVWAVKQLQRPASYTYSFASNLVRECMTWNNDDADEASAAELGVPWRPYVWFLNPDTAFVVSEKFAYSGAELIELQPKRVVVSAVVPMAAQLARALRNLHARDTAHYDLKPGNTLVSFNPRPRVVLIDFGISSLGVRWSTRQDTVQTVDVRAPEFILPDGAATFHGVASDWWTYGMFLISMVRVKPTWPLKLPAAEQDEGDPTKRRRLETELASIQKRRVVNSLEPEAWCEKLTNKRLADTSASSNLCLLDVLRASVHLETAKRGAPSFRISASAWEKDCALHSLWDVGTSVDALSQAKKQAATASAGAGGAGGGVKPTPIELRIPPQLLLDGTATFWKTTRQDMRLDQLLGPDRATILERICIIYSQIKTVDEETYVQLLPDIDQLIVYVRAIELCDRLYSAAVLLRLKTLFIKECPEMVPNAYKGNCAMVDFAILAATLPLIIYFREIEVGHVARAFTKGIVKRYKLLADESEAAAMLFTTKKLLFLNARFIEMLTTLNFQLDGPLISRLRQLKKLRDPGILRAVCEQLKTRTSMDVARTLHSIKPQVKIDLFGRFTMG